jgi:hypothetical protein
MTVGTAIATAPAQDRLQAAVNDAARHLPDAEVALHIARRPASARGSAPLATGCTRRSRATWRLWTRSKLVTEPSPPARRAPRPPAAA